jgi:hypothetical protein
LRLSAASYDLDAAIMLLEPNATWLILIVNGAAGL